MSAKTKTTTKKEKLGFYEKREKQLGSIISGAETTIDFQGKLRDLQMAGGGKVWGPTARALASAEKRKKKYSNKSVPAYAHERMNKKEAKLLRDTDIVKEERREYDEYFGASEVKFTGQRGRSFSFWLELATKDGYDLGSKVTKHTSKKGYFLVEGYHSTDEEAEKEVRVTFKFVPAKKGSKTLHVEVVDVTEIND